MYKISQIIPPGTNCVSLAEAKAYLRISHANDDALITDFIKAAEAAAEKFMRRAIVTQTYQVTYGYLGDNCYSLPYSPAQSVSEVRLIDNNITTALTASDYELSADCEAININKCTDKIEVDYVVGFTDVPEDIKQGILIHMAKSYLSPVPCIAIPTASKEAYLPYRRVRI